MIRSVGLVRGTWADASLCNAKKYSVGNLVFWISSILIGGKTLSMKTLFPGRMKQFSSSVEGFSSGWAGLVEKGAGCLQMVRRDHVQHRCQLCDKAW